MAVGVFDVEVALAPWGVLGFGLGLESCCYERRVDGVGVRNVHDHSAPKFDWAFVDEQVHEVRTELEAGKRLIRTAEYHGQAQDLSIKVHGTLHLVHPEGDRIYLHAVVSHYDVPTATLTSSSPH